MQMPKGLALPEIPKGKLEDYFRRFTAALENQHRQIRSDINTNFIHNLKSGATQAAAGAAKGERWYTDSHATLPDNVMMIGV